MRGMMRGMKAAARAPRPEALRMAERGVAGPGGGWAGWRGEVALVALLLLVGLAVRIWAWRWQPYVAVDGASYIALARTLFTAETFQTQQPPGYPLLIRMMLPLVPGGATPEGGVLAARIVALVAGLLLLVPFHALARRVLGGRWLALGVTALLALAPLAIRYSVTTTSESSYVLFLILGFFLLALDRNAPAGAALGAAFAIRPEGLVVAAAVGVARLFGARIAPPDAAPAPRSGGRWRGVLLLLAGFALAGPLPMLLFNHAVTGEWQLSRKGINLRSASYAANEPSPADIAAGRGPVALTDRLLDNLGDIARHWPGRTVALVGHLAGGAGWGFVAALAGLAAGSSWLLASALLPLLVAPLFLAVPMEPRFVFPLLPFALLIGFRVALRPPGRWRAIVGGGLLLTWALAAVPGARDLERHEGESYPELVAAGRALRNLSTPTTLFFDRKPFTAYYAGGQGRTPPLGPYMESIDAMLAAGGDYLVVHAFVARTFRPALLPLLGDPCVMLRDPRLSLIYLETEVANRAVAIYRFNRPGLAPVPPELFGGLWNEVAQSPCDPANAELHARLATLTGRR